MWIISFCILVLGIILTIRLSLVRPLGFALLAVGGFGVVWSLSHMDKWKDKKNRDDHRHFN